jgi:hypothetical protein
VAGVVAQPPVDLRFERGDLPVVELDEVAQRLHPDRVALIERCLVQEPLPFGAEDVIQPGQHTLFRQHGMHLGIEPGAQGDELGSEAHQLSQLAHRGRGDPRLGPEVLVQRPRVLARSDDPEAGGPSASPSRQTPLSRPSDAITAQSSGKAPPRHPLIASDLCAWSNQPTVWVSISSSSFVTGSPSTFQVGLVARSMRAMRKVVSLSQAAPR